MVAEFAICPYCHERVPLFIYAKHVARCKREHEERNKPKNRLKRFFKRLKRHLSLG